MTMTTKQKIKLSPTMQIAVTASALNEGAKAAEMSQMNVDRQERVRKVPLPNHLAAVLR